MANVLPLNTQKQLWRMYRARFIIAFSVLVFVLGLFAALLMVPSYLALKLAAPPSQDVTVAHKTGTADSAVSVARAQAIVLALSPVLASTSSPSSAIASALAGRPTGVSIDHIVYAQDTNQITLTGTAARDVVNAYRDTLAKNTLFSAVSIPVSALVGTQGGHFSVTLTLAQ